MKINKIICDVCSNEVNLNSDASLAMYERIEVKQKIDFIRGTKPEEELIKTSLDICKNCARELEIFLEKLKKEKQTKSELKK